MTAQFYGDSLKNYKGLENIKAVTYHEMFIKQTKGKWVSQVVLDV